MSTCRVLHVVQSISGGLGRYLVDLARFQQAAGLEVSIAYPGDDEPVAAAVDDIACLPWLVGPRPTWSLVSEIRALRRIARQVRPDVVHLHSSKAGLAGRLGLARSHPIVFQPHSWSFEADTGLLGTAARGWERLGARLANAVVCVSEGEWRRGTEAGLDDRRFVLITNGVDLATHPLTDPQRRDELRAEHGFGAAPTVVFVGRLHRQKGIDVLLAAWPTVRDAVPEARLVLVGDGPDRQMVEANADETVRIVGFDPQPGTWLAAADVVALPSRWEGMSLVLLEAMARGCSIVGTNVDGTNESLRDGRGGLVAVQDHEALADALVARLRDPGLRAREGAAARHHVEAHHDVRSAFGRISELYAALTAGG